LRRQQKPVMLVVNKVDGLDQDQAMADFYALGLPEVHPIAASQGRGVSRLMDQALADFPEPAQLDEEQQQEQGIKIAIAGRPNVGKSTLVNRMLSEERVVVCDEAGTTRDSIYIPFERHGKK